MLSKLFSDSIVVMKLYIIFTSLSLPIISLTLLGSAYTAIGLDPVSGNSTTINGSTAILLNKTGNLRNSGNYDISISEEESDRPFNPSLLTINTGNQVSWKNNDVEMHTVTSGTENGNDTGKYFDSSILIPGRTFEIQFNSTGDHPYFCILHPSMTGKIIVR